MHTDGTLVYNSSFRSYYYSLSTLLSIRMRDDGLPFESGNSYMHWDDEVILWME